MEYIVSVLLGIVGNLLTPTAKRFLRWPVEPDAPTRLPLPNIKERAVVSDEEKEGVRAYNRQLLAKVGRLCWIHVITFMFLLAAFYLPLMWKSMPGRDIVFSSTRLAIFGIERAFDHQRIGLLSMALALLFYVPVWFLSQPIGHAFATAWDHINKVTPERYPSLIALSFIAVAFLIAGHWIFVLFPQQSYMFSVGLPFIAVAAVGVLSSARR